MWNFECLMLEAECLALMEAVSFFEKKRYSVQQEAASDKAAQNYV